MDFGILHQCSISTLCARISTAVSVRAETTTTDVPKQNSSYIRRVKAGANGCPDSSKRGGLGGSSARVFHTCLFLPRPISVALLTMLPNYYVHSTNSLRTYHRILLVSHRRDGRPPSAKQRRSVNLDVLFPKDPGRRSAKAISSV